MYTVFVCPVLGKVIRLQLPQMVKIRHPPKGKALDARRTQLKETVPVVRTHRAEQTYSSRLRKTRRANKFFSNVHVVAMIFQHLRPEDKVNLARVNSNLLDIGLQAGCFGSVQSEQLYRDRQLSTDVRSSLELSKSP